MQACGNDFVVVDHASGVPAGAEIDATLARRIADRRFGVGCDQLLWLRPGGEGAAASVVIFNPDGSVAEMCGNGMRAIGVHLARRGADPGRSEYRVRVEAGKSAVDVAIDLRGRYPEVALGVPRVIRAAERLDPHGEFARVEIGNPHAVFFGDPARVERVALETEGAAIETHASFPNRTNVEFAAVLDRRRIRVRVWERGAGATLACGSGACAVVAAAEAKGLVDAGASIEVVLPGGSVFVRLEAGWREGRGQALLSGPAEDVFSGEWSG
jgi:diaminopimelate epimerase